MNPLIVIPTYWSMRKRRSSEHDNTKYDHSSVVGTTGELVRCLESLTETDGVGRIALLVASEQGAEEMAAPWVRTITASFPELDIITVGPEQVAIIHDRLTELGLGAFAEGIDLDGYGAIRNLGLALAAILGHDSVIFVDDDEVIEQRDFVERACYGLGGQTRRGVPVFVKTGIYLDRHGSRHAPEKKHWYDVRWRQNELFNRYIDQAMGGARLSRANTLYGGLTAIHYEAFRRVSYDPWITRGEDLDYLIDLRMYGLESWLDDQWTIRHLPPERLSEDQRFARDAYRWIYQQQKVEFGRSQIDLLQVRPHDLDPYPGPFLDAGIGGRVVFTAFLRSIALRGRGYMHIALKVKRDAEAWAAKNCRNYFEFQYHWPEVIARIEGDDALAELILNSEADARLALSEKLFEEARYEEAQNILVTVQEPRSYRSACPESQQVLTVDGDLTSSFEGIRLDAGQSELGAPELPSRCERASAASIPGSMPMDPVVVEDGQWESEPELEGELGQEPGLSPSFGAQIGPELDAGPGEDSDPEPEPDVAPAPKASDTRFSGEPSDPYDPSADWRR